MANKVFGVKNITHLLYGLIVLLPMFAILGRVIYTQSNQSAKDSYSDKTYTIQQKLSTTNFNDLVNDTNAFLQLTYDSQYDNTSFNSQRVNFRQLHFNNTIYNEGSFLLGYRRGEAVGNYLQIFDTQNNRLGFWSIADVEGTYQFYLVSVDTASYYETNNMYGNSIAYILLTSTENTLDNAFEYSLKTFTDDNNLGEVDMFSWFTDLFLDHNNAHNQIYIGFVNWYLNYTMLVSCGYLFFLVLIWFINFVRKILDKSMYQDYGGF